MRIARRAGERNYWQSRLLPNRVQHVRDGARAIQVYVENGASPERDAQVGDVVRCNRRAYRVAVARVRIHQQPRDRGNGAQRLVFTQHKVGPEWFEQNSERQRAANPRRRDNLPVDIEAAERSEIETEAEV